MYLIIPKICLTCPGTEGNTEGEVVVIPTSNISKYLAYNDIRSLNCVSKNLNSIFKDERDVEKETIRTFLTYVAHGEKAQVEEMIKRDPRLLLEKIKVTDEAGRTIYGTAYQIALGAKDVSPFPNQFDEMAEMIERYLMQHFGEEERNKQYNEQFPEGFEKEEEARKQRDNDAVEKVFAAVDKATSDQEIEEAINEFKKYLKNENNREFKTGYHFNEAIFIRAMELYDKYYDQFGGFDSKKNNAVAVGVLGGIEGYFTANLAQAMCDGVKSIVENKKPLSRKKVLDDCKTSFFDPCLGVSHFVYSYYGVRVRAGCVSVRRLRRAAVESPSRSRFSKLMSSKNNNLIKRQNIVAKREPKKDSSICLIQ